MDSPTAARIRAAENDILKDPSRLISNSDGDTGLGLDINIENSTQWDDIPKHPKKRDREAYEYDPALEIFGIRPTDQDLLSLSTLDKSEVDAVLGLMLLAQPMKKRRLRHGKLTRRTIRRRRDFFGDLAQYPELIMELALNLSLPELISLYAISKDFHETINGHLAHVMKAYAALNAPESGRVFKFNMYESLCIPDPVGRNRPIAEVVRMVPSLRWVQMVVHREKAVRDILACMARDGHRMPKTMSLSLKKMWLTMDISTSARRVQLMHNEIFWTDNDIYNIQLFMIKLEMRFNDPIDGPADDGMKKLFLGQRGLTPLCKLLKRTDYVDIISLIQCAVRYAYKPKPEHRGLPIFGIPAEEIGIGHLEGWGKGKIHLYRMDELIMREACRRHLNLDKHMLGMLLWGYVDPVTRRNIKVTEEEMYMSDDEEKPKMDTTALEKDEIQVEEEWETDDEDMADETMPDDNADSATIGASGYRRDRTGEPPKPIR